MKNAEYWRGRALILEEAAHKRAEELTAGLDEIYDEAMYETQKELESWYLRLAKNNNLTLADAKKLLTKNELDEFHWDVEKHIKVGEDHGLEPDWMKKLENASAKFHISRLEAVETRIQQKIEELHAEQTKRLETHLKKVAGDTYLRTAYEVQKGVGIGFDITYLDEKKLDTFISNPWTSDDRTFRDRCWTMKENLVESVRKSLIKGLIRGDAPGKLTKEIQKEFNVSKYKAGRLVNTETAYFAMQSTKQCYKDINVDMVEVVGTLDSHTCDLCGSFDGKVIRMADFEPGVTAPPWHPNCRCTTAPAIPDEYKGTRLARDEDGKQYEVPGDMSFDEWKGKFVGEGIDKPGNTVYNSSAEQLYRPVTRGASAEFNIRSDQKIAVKRVESYADEVYISDKAEIKPKALHEIKHNTDKAREEWGISSKPKIIVVSEDEMPDVLGRYDPVENTVYYMTRITESQIRESTGGKGTVELHEMWHMKQAEKFRKTGWKITTENRGEYMKALCKKCKKTVEKLGVTYGNVGDISQYAKLQFERERYDEVEAEYYTMKRRRKR